MIPLNQKNQGVPSLRTRCATLVELLVVMAIITALARGALRDNAHRCQQRQHPERHRRRARHTEDRAKYGGVFRGHRVACGSIVEHQGFPTWIEPLH